MNQIVTLLHQPGLSRKLADAIAREARAEGGDAIVRADDTALWEVFMAIPTETVDEATKRKQHEDAEVAGARQANRRRRAAEPHEHEYIGRPRACGVCGEPEPTNQEEPMPMPVVEAIRGVLVDASVAGSSHEAAADAVLEVLRRMSPKALALAGLPAIDEALVQDAQVESDDAFDAEMRAAALEAAGPGARIVGVTWAREARVAVEVKSVKTTGGRARPDRPEGLVVEGWATVAWDPGSHPIHGEVTLRLPARFCTVGDTLEFTVHHKGRAPDPLTLLPQNELDMLHEGLRQWPATLPIHETAAPTYDSLCSRLIQARGLDVSTPVPDGSTRRGH